MEGKEKVGGRAWKGEGRIVVSMDGFASDDSILVLNTRTYMLTPALCCLIAKGRPQSRNAFVVLVVLAITFMPHYSFASVSSNSLRSVTGLGPALTSRPDLYRRTSSI